MTVRKEQLKSCVGFEDLKIIIRVNKEHFESKKKMNLLFFLTLVFTLFVCSICSKHGGGHSEIHHKQDGHGKYKFGYKVHDPWGSHFHKESGDPWAKKGSYGIKLADGRERIVKYIADKGGFRASIHTNEPGTANIDSADAIVNGPDHHGHSHSHIPSGHKKYSHEPEHHEKHHHEPKHHEKYHHEPKHHEQYHHEPEHHGQYHRESYDHGHHGHHEHHGHHGKKDHAEPYGYNDEGGHAQINGRSHENHKHNGYKTQEYYQPDHNIFAVPNVDKEVFEYLGE